MSILALKCPNCRGDLEMDDSRELGFCQFCGTKILIQEEKRTVEQHITNLNNYYNVQKSEQDIKLDALKYHIESGNISKAASLAYEAGHDPVFTAHRELLDIILIGAHKCIVNNNLVDADSLLYVLESIPICSSDTDLEYYKLELMCSRFYSNNDISTALRFIRTYVSKKSIFKKDQTLETILSVNGNPDHFWNMLETNAKQKIEEKLVRQGAYYAPSSNSFSRFSAEDVENIIKNYFDKGMFRGALRNYVYMYDQAEYYIKRSLFNKCDAKLMKKYIEETDALVKSINRLPVDVSWHYDMSDVIDINRGILNYRERREKNKEFARGIEKWTYDDVTEKNCKSIKEYVPEIYKMIFDKFTILYEPLLKAISAHDVESFKQPDIEMLIDRLN